MKKSILLLLVLAMLLGLCACSEAAPEEQPDLPQDTQLQQPTQSSMTLPVAHNDTLDPFKAQSEINRALIPLIYDSLVYIDEGFVPVELLAQNCSSSGTNVTVSLRHAIFTDASAVTAEDVVYSFEQAKKSEYYSARLSNFTKAEISGSSVLFTLKSPDIYATACLDFPIVKSGTVEPKYESIELYEITPPIGTGRYKLNGTVPNATLTANPHNVRGEAPHISTISLYEATNSDGLAYGLQIGNFDVWYNSLASGKYTRVNANRSTVPTNNLVYLAFNSDKAIFQQAEVRRAVSMLADREEISSVGFQGHATPATAPFNPYWSAMSNIAVNGSSSALKEQALQLLESAGYTNINTYGYRCSNTKSLNCTLTVCKNNAFKLAAAEQIKEQLATVNFNVEIIRLSYEDYVKAVENGEFDMYLGEIKLSANMDLSAFFTASGAANAVVFRETGEGTAEISPICDAYKKLCAGEYSLSDFCLLFEKEAPFIPLCYRSGAMFYSRDFETEVNPTCYDIFFDICNWQIKTQSEDK